MSRSLTKSQINIYRNAFKLMDLNTDGRISLDELRELLRKLGRDLTVKEARSMLRKVGAKHKSRINFRTFVDLVVDVTKLPPQPNEKLEEALKGFDWEDEGYVLGAELYYVLTKTGNKLSEEEATYLLSNLSLDENGRVKISDIVKLIGVKNEPATQ